VRDTLAELWRNQRLRTAIAALSYAAGAAAVGYVAISLRYAENTGLETTIFASYWPLWVVGMVLVAAAVLLWPRRSSGRAA
jgi:hypothetical protein